MIKKLLTFFKKEAPSLKEEKKVHADILNNIFKLKQKIGLIIDYEKIFNELLLYCEYELYNQDFYFEGMHPELIRFFSKFKYIKAKNSSDEYGHQFMKIYEEVDNEEYIVIGIDNNGECYIVKKNSDNIDHSHDVSDDDFMSMYEKIFIDILYSLIDDEIITLNEFLKILQYIEKLSVAK